MPTPSEIMSFLSLTGSMTLSLMFRLFLITGLYYALTQIAFMAGLTKGKVNSAPLFKSQIWFEIKYSILSQATYVLIGLNFYYARNYGWGQVYNDINEFGRAYFIFSIAAMLVLVETNIYWSHRAFHSVKSLVKYHQIHHRSIVSTPWTAQSFGFVEALSKILPGLVIPYIFPIHPSAFFTANFIAFFSNLYGHGNFEFVPRKVRNLRPFCWLHTPITHAHHHIDQSKNLGFMTNIWDRVFGTFHDPDAQNTLTEVHPLDQNRSA